MTGFLFFLSLFYFLGRLATFCSVCSDYWRRVFAGLGRTGIPNSALIQLMEPAPLAEYARYGYILLNYVEANLKGKFMSFIRKFNLFLNTSTIIHTACRFAENSEIQTNDKESRFQKQIDINLMSRDSHITEELASCLSVRIYHVRYP